MQQQPKPELSREEIYQILLRHRGAANQLARDIERSRHTVSFVLRGKATSQYILDAARLRAQQLLEQEQNGKAA